MLIWAAGVEGDVGHLDERKRRMSNLTKDMLYVMAVCLHLIFYVPEQDFFR